MLILNNPRTLEDECRKRGLEIYLEKTESVITSEEAVIDLEIVDNWRAINLLVDLKEGRV